MSIWRPAAACSRCCLKAIDLTYASDTRTGSNQRLFLQSRKPAPYKASRRMTGHYKVSQRITVHHKTPQRISRHHSASQTSQQECQRRPQGCPSGGLRPHVPTVVSRQLVSHMHPTHARAATNDCSKSIRISICLFICICLCIHREDCQFVFAFVFACVFICICLRIRICIHREKIEISPEITLFV